jgi:hypothetical protein
MRKPAALLFMAAGLVFSGSSFALADSTKQPLFPKMIALDGRVFSGNNLLLAFKEIAFSSFIAPNVFPDMVPPPPFEPCARPTRSPSKICGTPTQYKERYPWLYEYLYRDHGTPKYFAINKWTGPIRISFGFPNDLAPVVSSHWQQSGTDEMRKQQSGNCAWTAGNPNFCIDDARDLTANALPNDKTFPVAQQEAEEEVKAALPVLHELTGLPVSYIPHNQETSDSFGNLRIVLVRRSLNTGFKDSVVPSGLVEPPGMGLSIFSQPLSYATVETALTTAVHFTPYSDQQVDGYLLPNADNSIGMSFCFIWEGVSSPVMRALVRECLVRSLGLPNAPALGPTMILGLWNQHVPFGLFRMEAPIEAKLTDIPRLIQEQMKLWRPNAPLRMPPITEFDRFMVKTLYSPSIKPGMSLTDF